MTYQDAKEDECYKLYERIDQLEAQLDWLLARVIVDSRGVALPCGYTKVDKESGRKALAALIQEKGECPHQFHYFGEQKTRRCVKCNKLESEQDG